MTTLAPAPGNSPADGPRSRRRIAAVAACAALLVPAGLAVTAVEASAAAKYYSSCDDLHKDFKYGVAKSRRAAKKQVRDGYHRPAYGKKAKGVYRENHSRLDADDDGTACES